MSLIRLVRMIAGQRVKVETHRQPHFDEIASLWLVEKFAGGDWVLAHCPENELQLGIGGGEFDEHPNGGGQSARRDCCLELVARSLGLEQDPRLVQMLRFAHVVDVDGKGQPFDIHNMTKLINLQHPKDPRFVIRWVYAGLDAKFAEQEDFAGSIEAVKAGEKRTIGQPSTGLRLLVVSSDCGTIVKAAMTVFRDAPPDVIIQRRSTGNTMIFTNKRSCIQLDQVIIELRKAEAQVSGFEYPPDANLSVEGFLEPDKAWYYFRPQDGAMILNGSNTAEVSPTWLTLHEVIARVEAGLE